MDALSETLRVVRLVGAVFINGRFTAPWCYHSPHADVAAPVLEPGADRKPSVVPRASEGLNRQPEASTNLPRLPLLPLCFGHLQIPKSEVEIP